MYTQILISSSIFIFGLFTGKQVAFKQAIAIVEKHIGNKYE